MLQTYVGLIGNPLTADGPTLSNSSAATSLLGTAAAGADARPTLPNNFFQIGKVLRVHGRGRVSNIVTTPGTLTIDLRFGSTVVANGGAMQLSTTAHTNVPIAFDFELTCRAVGGAANLMPQGICFSQALSISGADPTTGHSLLLIPNTAPAVGNNFDSSATQQLDCFGTFSSASSGNAITLHQFYVEAAN